MADDTATDFSVPGEPRRQAQSIRAEQRFLASLVELGAMPLYDEWKGINAPHAVRCANGHECAPWPCGVRRGQGICRECVGLGPKAPWAAFRQLVTSNGGTVLEDRWLGAIVPHRVKCAAGHITTPRPHDAKATGSFCSVCVGRNSEAAWHSFRAMVVKNGGTIVETEWLGNHVPHRVTCANGHGLTVAPSKVTSRNRIPCRHCEHDRCAAQYEELIKAHGGIVLERYQNSSHRHRSRCAKGHEVRQTPAHLVAGGPLCRRCAYREWDVFYIVMDEVNDVIKFGITSGKPSRRLGEHAKDGFDQVVRLHTALPDDVAPWLERAIISALRDAREEPVRGREYYRSRVLPVVLDLVDNHPAIRAAA